MPSLITDRSSRRLQEVRGIDVLKGANLTFSLAGLLFIVVGVLLRVLASGVDGFLEALPETSLNIGVSILAVSIVSVLWRQVGNDPIQQSVDELTRVIDLFVDGRKTGVMRIHEKRQDFVTEHGYELLREKMRSAHKIDLMGRVLYDGWANNAEVIDILKEIAATRNCQIRILVLDPEGIVAKRRDAQEARLKGVELASVQTGRLAASINSSIAQFKKVRQALPAAAQDNLTVKIVQDIEMYSQIVRIDDYLWVHLYLYHLTGGSSPSLEIEGANTALFKKYAAEFEELWRQAHEPPG